MIALATALLLVTGLVPMAAGAAVGPSAVALIPDAYEPLDDNPVTAPMLSEVTWHTLHDSDDEDWSIISAETTGQPFVLECEPFAPGYQADLYMYVYEMNEDGTAGTLLDSNDDGTFNTYGSALYFEAPAPGDYLVEVEVYEEGSFGTYRMTQAYGIARRISGSNRFATSAAVSKTLWPMTDLYYNYGVDNPEAVVVANGLDYADALAGSSFANQVDGVLLLTLPGMLPSEVEAEITRLLTAAGTATEVPCYVLGGPNAVSDDVFDRLEMFDGFASVDRLAGGSRYGTAVAIAEELFDWVVLPTTAFVVSGESPWDALATGPVAAHSGAPILMTRKSTLPSETATFITDNLITDVVVIGGVNAVSADVFNQIDALPGVTAMRVAGGNRYDTAREVAQYGVDNGMDAGSVVLVSGQTFADGLSAGTIEAFTDGPMLLTARDYVPDEVYEFFEDNGMPTDPSYVVGGPAAVSADAYEEFQLGIWFYLDSLVP